MVALVAWCGALQVALGAPFLAANAAGYLERSFELGRVFMFKWTVNWKFLPEEVFVSGKLAAGLMALSAASWLAFGHFRWASREGGLTFMLKRLHWASGQHVPSFEILDAMLVSNFVGIAFARSLHYQFYSWYAYTLPWLLWLTPFPTFVRIVVLVAVEIVYNIFPATPASSVALQALHVLILVGVWLGTRTEADPLITEDPISQGFVAKRGKGGAGKKSSHLRQRRGKQN